MDKERQRKVEAGRERFAELMKKKNVRDSGNEGKKKKMKRMSTREDDTMDNNSTCLESQMLSENATFPVNKTPTDNVSSSEDSVSSEKYSFSTSEQEILRSSDPSLTELTQFELSDPVSQILIENQIKSDTIEDGVLTITESEWKLKLDGYNKKLQEYKNALQHRDEIITQLSVSLQASIEQRNQLQSESQTQAEMMADEIEELKHQLHQATELLRSQKGKNGISAQELFDAKNEVFTLQNANKHKDQMIAEVVKQLNERNKELDDREIDFGIQMQKLKENVIELESQRDQHQRTEQELIKMLEKTKQEFQQQTNEFMNTHQKFVQDIRQKDDEMQQLREQLQEMKRKASDDVQQLMKTLEQLQQQQPPLEVLNSQVEEGKAIVRAELDELHGLQISQMKSQMRQEFEIQFQQLKTQLSQCSQERDYFQNELSKFQESSCRVEVGEEEMQIDCSATDSEKNQSSTQHLESQRLQNDSCALNLNSDLQGVMREIVELKNENERLRRIVNSNNGNSEDRQHEINIASTQRVANEFAFESGDHSGKLQTEVSMWKFEHDKVLKEKLELEIKVNSMLESNNPTSGEQTVKENEILARRIKKLEEELKSAFEFKTKCEMLESEKNSLNEKHMNQINSFEKRKMELELRVCELESRYEVLLKSKQAVESQWMEKAVNNSLLSTEQIETSDAQLLIEQIATSEKDVTVLTLRLQAQEELKCALNAKLEHLVKTCEKYAWQQNLFKNEIEALQNQLQHSWQQHENTLEELRNTQKNLMLLQDEERKRVEINTPVQVEKVQLRTEASLEANVLQTDGNIVPQNHQPQNEYVNVECIRCKKLLEQLENHGIGLESSMCDGELLDLRQKMKLVMDSNRELLEEKEAWLFKLNEQQQVLENLQSMVKNPGANEEQDSFHLQLRALHERQNELVTRLEEQNKNQVRFYDVLEERNVLQEALRREKEVILQKIKEKEELESKLIRQKVEFERLQFERKHLEEILWQKDVLEQELKRQRRSLEDDLTELEHLLKDREDMIRFEKAQLEMEMKKKDLVLKKWQSDLKEKQLEFDCLESTMQAKQEERLANVQIRLQSESLRRIEQLRNDMDNHHSMAMDRLKRDLINHFAVREGRLVECHLAEMSRLQDEHHLQQMKIIQRHPEVEQTESSLLMTRLNQMVNIDKDYQQLTSTECLMEQIVKKLTAAEINLLHQQINIEIACQQQRFAMVCQAESKAAEVKAEHAKQMALVDLRENLTKTHKDELNSVLRSFQTRVDCLHRDHNQQLASILDVDKLSSHAIFERLRVQVQQEFEEAVQNLTQDWGSDYLERLASLRKEVEEKFREASSSHTFPEEKGRGGVEDREEDEEEGKKEKEQDGGQQFKQIQSLLEEKEEILSKVTELRKNLEETQTSEMKIMKERLQTEFTSVLEIQTEMKKDVESGQSPLVIELRRVKEEYEKLQEKYEEITKEEITVEEAPLEEDGSQGKKEVTVIHKITELPGAESQHVEKSYDKFVFEDPREQQEAITLEEELKKLRTKLEEKHVKEMEHLRVYFEKRCEDMEKKYVDEVSRLKSSQTENEEELEEEDREFVLPESKTHLTTLTHFCDTSHVLESSLEELEEHYKAELDQKLEELRKELESKYQSDLNLLTEETEARVKAECEQVRAELAEKYSRQIEDITRRHEEEVELLASKFSEDLAKAITDVRLECSADSAKEIEGESKKLAEEMKEKCERDLNNLQAELDLKHQKEMEILQARFNAQKAEEINNAVMELRSNLQMEREQFLEKESQNVKGPELEELRLKIEAELKVDHEKELEFIRSQCDEKCNKMKEQLDKVMSEKAEQQEKQSTDRVELECEVQSAITEELEPIEQSVGGGEETNEESKANKQPETRSELESPDAEADKLNLLESHQVELEERENLLAISTLKEQLRDEISEVHREYEKKVNDLKNGWEKQVKEAEARNEELRKEHAKEVEQLKAAYEKQLSDEKIRWQEELTADHIVKFEAVTQELDSCHRLELEDMRHAILKDHEEAMEQLQHDLLMKEKEFQILTQELKENHERDLEELGQQHKVHLAAEVKRVRAEMDKMNDEKLQAVALDAEVLKSELEDVHRKEIIELQEKMSKKHQEEMEEEIKKVIAEMESLKETFRCKIEEEHGKQLQVLRDELQLSCESQLQALREECLAEKEVEIKELRLNFEEQLAQASSHMLSERSILNLDEKIFEESEEEQLKVPVNLEETSDKTELQPADIITRRIRENEENENLIVLLEQEVKEIRSENDNLCLKYQRLKEVLSDVINSYAKVEMIINKQLTAIANAEDSEQSSPTKTVYFDETVNESNIPETLETSALSFLSDDGFELDLSQRITTATCSEFDLDPENEQLVNAISNNLQLAVTRLLRLLTVTVHQCHEAKLAQMELVNTATSHGEEAAIWSNKYSELEGQLIAEVQSKERLADELRKHMELLESLKNENKKLENDLRKNENEQHNLFEQLEQAQKCIKESEERMVEEKNHFDRQRTLISEGLDIHEQISAVKSDVSTENNLTGDQGLLEENSQLHADHSNLQRQSEKDKQQLTKRVHDLEMLIEEQVSHSEQQLEQKRREIEDLHQQVEALEKQLKADKKFFEAQTAEYEQEREDSQREINRLQNAIREKEKQLGSGDRLSHELESLSMQLLDKTQSEKEILRTKSLLETELHKLTDKISDWQEIVKNLESQLEEKSRAEQDLTEQVQNLQNILSQSTQANEELSSELEILRATSNASDISSHVQFLEDQLETRSRELDSFRNSDNFMLELRGQIRNLEAKVEKKTRELEALQISASSLSSPSSEDLSLRDQLEAMRSMRVDDLTRTASPCYFDDIRRLEEKLEALTRAEEVAIKKTRDMEMLLRKQKQVEEELLQDKEALQQQVNSQLLQISALQARIEEWRHNIDNTDAAEKILRLQQNAERDRELLEKREKEIDEMREQLDQLRHRLVAREEEISNLTIKQGRAQYEIPRQKIQDSELVEVRNENEKLKTALSELQEQLSGMAIPSFAQTLLEEKNQEIDHLTQQLNEMQADLDNLTSSQAGDASLSETEVVTKMEPMTLSSLKKSLKEKDEKLKRMEELLQAGQEEMSLLQRVNSEKDVLSQTLQQKEAEVKRVQEVAEHRKREVESLRGVLKEKQALLEQVETLQGEITSLTEFQTKLQEDYDTVQSMLEDNQKDLLNIQQLLVEKDASLLLEQRNSQDRTAEFKMIIERKDSEISCLQERLDLMAQNGALKQDELRKEITSLRDKLKPDEDSIELLRHQSNNSELNVQGVSTLGDMSILVDHSKEMKLSDDSTKARESQTSELEMRNKEIERLNLEKSELEHRLNELLQNEVEVKKKLKITEAEVSKLRSSLKDTNFGEDIKKFQQQVQETKMQVQHYKEEFGKTAEELQRAKNYHSALELELASIPKLKKQLKEKDVFIEGQRKEVEKMKGLNSQLENEIERLKTSKEEKKKSAAHKKEIDLIDGNQLKELKSKCSSLEKELKTKMTELDAKRKDFNNLQATHSDLETKSLLQQSEIDKLKDEVDQYHENFETMQNVLDLEKDNARKIEDKYKQELHDVHKSYKLKIESLKGKRGDESQPMERKISSSKQLSKDGNMDSEAELLPPEIPSEMQTLLQKVYREGVQVLSLSELLFLRSFNQTASDDANQDWKSEAWTLHRAWDNEKQQLLAEIVALKDLLTQATEAAASLRTTGQATAELSNQLLQAVATVFQKEREAMVAELRTQILASKATSPNEIDRLEQRIKAMDSNQQIVMSRVQQLLEDPDSLKQHDVTKRLNKERLKQHKEREQFLKQISKLEEDISQRERHFKKQIELLEYRAKQEQMMAEDLRISLQMEKKHALDLSSQLSCEKGINADLDTALTITRSELLKVQSLNEGDRREIQTLSAACESEKFRAQALLQALESEQNNFTQLQEAMEAEKRRSKSSNERQQQIIQELQRSLEVVKDNHQKALSALEQERQNHSNTLQKLDAIQMKQNIVVEDINTDVKVLDLNQNLDLTSALERERQRVVTLSNTLAQERASAVEELEREQSLSRRLHNKLDSVQEHNSEIKRELQREKEKTAQLDMECAQLRSQLILSREQELQRQTNWETKRQLEREQQRENELQHEHDRQKQRELELEVHKQLQRGKILEKEIEHLRERTNQLQSDLESERRKQNRPQKPEIVVKPQGSNSSISNIHECHLLETAKQQLQCLVFKCQQELDSITKQVGFGDSVIQNVTGILKSFVTGINEVKTDVTIPGDMGDLRLQQFLEQVLLHNAELVGFVIQLCEDKMELRRLQMKLEEELMQIRHKQASADQDFRRTTSTSDDILNAERLSWAQERANLQLALHKAEAEVTQLKSALQLSSGSFSLESLNLNTSSGKIDDKLRRLHLKYLRAESFRKALIYQKKYLLILLGGFQESEAATLVMISQMGISALSSAPSSVIRHPTQLAAFQRFRSAARVIIAICRMKYLVRRWRHHSRIFSSGYQENENSANQFGSGFEQQFLNGKTPSVPSLDDMHVRIHRIGTTPPVRDFRGLGSYSISERSGSSAKKSLVASLAASSDNPSNPNVLLPLKSDKSLQKYLERLESIHQHLGVASTSRLPVTTSEPHETTQSQTDS